MTTDENKQYLFATAKVPKAVFYLAIPTIISQLITIIYNWADTFFVGQLNDTSQLAAVTICQPIFLVTTAIANLLGIGGAGAIARALGKQNYERIKKISVFSTLMAIFVSLFYSLIIFLISTPLLYFLGANDGNIESTKSYLFWVIILGSLPSVINPTLAHLIRSTGKSLPASIGITFGGVINMILDPIFIFGFHLDVTGAAIATFISNILACLFFIIYLIITRKKSILSFNIKHLKIKEKVGGDILSTGSSGFLLSLMAVCSNASITKLMSGYSDAAISAMNIAKKVDLCIIAFAQGLAQGILPLIGYNYASHNQKRMSQIIRFSILLTTIFSLVCVAIFLAFPKFLVSLFIKDTDTVNYAQNFLRILCLSMPLTSLIFIYNTIFQATKETGRALTTIIFRKGLIDIPLMIGLNVLIPIYGIVISQPIVDSFSALIAIILYLTFLKKNKKRQKTL